MFSLENTGPVKAARPAGMYQSLNVAASTRDRETDTHARFLKDIEAPEGADWKTVCICHAKWGEENGGSWGKVRG